MTDRNAPVPVEIQLTDDALSRIAEGGRQLVGDAPPPSAACG